MVLFISDRKGLRISDSLKKENSNFWLERINGRKASRTKTIIILFII